MRERLDPISGLYEEAELKVRKSWDPGGRPEKSLTKIWEGICDLASYATCGMYGMEPTDVAYIADVTVRMFLAALDTMPPKKASKAAAKLPEKLAGKIQEALPGVYRNHRPPECRAETPFTAPRSVGQ